MEKLSMNTDKIKEQGEELKQIANELSNLMNAMYTRLTSIKDDKIWSGDGATNSSQVFIEKIKKDKANNIHLCQNLSQLGNAIIQYSNDVSSSADTSVRGE